MAKETRKLNLGSVSRFWIRLVFAAGLPASAVALPAAAEPESLTAGNHKKTSLPRPVIMSDFTVYVMKGNDLSEEVKAREALLYQSLNIAHLYRVHVNFLKEDKSEQDTLDAPEGYLYLKDLTLTPRHPFYREIGGEDAITTTTFFHGGKADSVWRAAKDIDLIGTYARRVVYRRTDGTTVTCRRGYRSAVESRLYGVGDCRMEGRWNLSGQRVTVDDQMTSSIRVLGSPRARGIE